MTPQEAADLVAVLRTMYPDGDAPPELIVAYAGWLVSYDHEAALAGVERVMHTYQSRRFPALAIVEHAIAEASPAEAAWQALTAALEDGGLAPPDWPDKAGRQACAAMGGWGTFQDWDGSRDALRQAFVTAYTDTASEPSDRPRIGQGEQKTINVSGDEHCAYCADSGWVELAGTVEALGITYPVGATACRWCEQGEIVYKAVAAGKADRGRILRRPLTLRSEYAEADLASPVAERGVAVSLAEYAVSPAGAADPALQDAKVRVMLGLASA